MAPAPRPGRSQGHAANNHPQSSCQRCLLREPDRRPSARQFWLGYASDPRGRLILDEGAVRAVRERHASLLAAGITGVVGDFLADDPVELVGPDGAVVARGLVAYDARELPALLGRKTGDLAPEYRREVVHRDEMVLVGRRSRA